MISQDQETDPKIRRQKIVKCATQAFDIVLKPNGFKRIGGNWFRTLNELIHVVNIQRSPWGNEFYVNIGVRFSQIIGLIEAKNPLQPKEYECQVRGRMSYRTEHNDYIQLERACQYNSDLSEPVRAGIFKEAIETIGIPFLTHFENITNAKAAIEKPPPEISAMITRDVFEYYGLKPKQRDILQ